MVATIINVTTQQPSRRRVEGQRETETERDCVCVYLQLSGGRGGVCRGYLLFFFFFLSFFLLFSSLFSAQRIGWIAQGEIERQEEHRRGASLSLLSLLAVSRLPLHSPQFLPLPLPPNPLYPSHLLPLPLSPPPPLPRPPSLDPRHWMAVETFRQCDWLGTET